MQDGYQSGTEWLGELPTKERRVTEEEGSQVIQCQI